MAKAIFLKYERKGLGFYYDFVFYEVEDVRTTRATAQDIVERALKMYFSNNFSIREIKELTGLCKTTIYKYVRLHKRT